MKFRELSDSLSYCKLLPKRKKMDKDVQMISLLLNTLKDLFKILRDLKGELELQRVIGDLQDATKPYSLKLAEPGIITLNPDLIRMKMLRKSINEGETVPEVVSLAEEMLLFVQTKNEKLSKEADDLPEFAEFVDSEYAGDMPPAVGSDNSDAGNSPGGTMGGGETPDREVIDGDNKEDENSNHDDNDGPPGNNGGSSSSDS